MKFLAFQDISSNPYMPLMRRMAESDSGGGGGAPSGGQDDPYYVVLSDPSSSGAKATPMFKNLVAAQGYIAMHLFINSNMDTQNGVAGKAATQAAADAVARSGAIISVAGEMIKELCEE